MDTQTRWTIIGVIVAAIIGILSWIVANRQSREKQNISGLFGKLWNLIKRKPWQVTLGLIGVLTVVLILWALKMPVVQDSLSTKIDVTVGTIIVIALLILGLAIIWIFFNRRRWLKVSTHAKKREAKIVEQDQQIAKLKGELTKNEKLIKQFYEQQESNSKRQNELMRERNELHHKLRDKESLISSHEYLISEYGLYIISATYGVHGKKTENVTEKVILRLAEKGEVLVDNDVLVGYDLAEGQPKKLKVDYLYGEEFSMAIPEVDQKLLIEDLSQNAKDNKPKDSLDYSGLTGKSRWKIE